MTRMLIAGNWKMNGDISMAQNLATTIAREGDAELRISALPTLHSHSNRRGRDWREWHLAGWPGLPCC